MVKGILTALIADNKSTITGGKSSCAEGQRSIYIYFPGLCLNFNFIEQTCSMNNILNRVCLIGKKVVLTHGSTYLLFIEHGL